jgi:arginase
MNVISVPYHQDERLPADVLPLPSAAGVTTVDPDLPEGDIWHRLGALYDLVADRVADGVAGDAGTTVVSGDCLVTLASVAGAQRAGSDPAVVWFDAHGDVHTLQSSTSGYLGGLSLRLLLGAHPELLAEGLRLRPVPEERTVLVDARDLDPAEVDYLAGSAVRRTAVAELDAGSLPDGPLVLHVDVDVIDAAEVPGLLFPAPGGPSTGAVLAAMARVAATGRVVVTDLAFPWQPAADRQQRRHQAELVEALLRASAPGDI